MTTLTRALTARVLPKSAGWHCYGKPSTAGLGVTFQQCRWRMTQQSQGFECCVSNTARPVWEMASLQASGSPLVCSVNGPSREAGSGRGDNRSFPQLCLHVPKLRLQATNLHAEAEHQPCYHRY